MPKTAASVFTFTDQFREWLAASDTPLHYDDQYLQNGYEMYTTGSQGLFADSMYETIKPSDMLSKFVGNRDCIQHREANTPILTDMNPWLEYYFFHEPFNQPLRCR